MADEIHWNSFPPQNKYLFKIIEKLLRKQEKNAQNSEKTKSKLRPQLPWRVQKTRGWFHRPCGGTGGDVLAHTRQANETETLQQPKGSSLKEGDLEKKWLPASHYQSVSGLCSGLRGRRVSPKISTHRSNLTQVPSLSLHYHMIRKKHRAKNYFWVLLGWS